MRNIKFYYSVLNITMHPHSPEMYLDLFKELFPNRRPAQEQYFGNDYISLTLGEESLYKGVSYLPGTIKKFTKIGEQDWYDIEEGLVLKDEDRPDIDINRFYPNLSTFDFVFLPKGHRLFFVHKLRRENLSQAYFARSLQRIFDTEKVRSKYGDIAVTVEMNDLGMEAIYRIGKLERLTIRVTLPNSDDLSPEKASFIARMEAQGISRIDETMKAHNDKSITPDKNTKALMELAQSNGFIIATGIDNGKRVTRKSSEFPISEVDYYDQDGGSPCECLIKQAIEKIYTYIRRQKK